jgi:hypothetical protein
MKKKKLWGAFPVCTHIITVRQGNFLALSHICRTELPSPDGFSGRANRGYDTHKLYVIQIDILYNPLRKLV